MRDGGHGDDVPDVDVCKGGVVCAGGWARRFVRVGSCVSVRACGRGGCAGLGWAGLAVTRRLGRPGDSDRPAGRAAVDPGLWGT